MFSCAQIGGISAGFPDVCKTPLPPIPHPNEMELRIFGTKRNAI